MTGPHGDTNLLEHLQQRAQRAAAAPAGHYLATVPAGCVCNYTSHRDPAEPHMPAWHEAEQADDCPVHPLGGAA